MIDKLMSSGLVSSKMALNLLKNQLEKESGFKVDAYVISYVRELNSMEFKLKEKGADKLHTAKFSNEHTNLASIIEAMTKSEIKDGTLDGFKLVVGDKSLIEVFFSGLDGESHHTKIEL